MRKRLLIRVAAALLIESFLLYAGPRVGEAPAESFYLKNRRPAPPEYAGTIVLYHVVTHRTYQGSVTAFLQERAEAFNRAHFGVRVTVEGMDEASFSERLDHGRRADMYSFFSGVLYEEQLQPASFSAAAALRPGLAVTPCAGPWFFSGYVSVDQGETEPVAALANGAKGPVTDLRTWGDRERNGGGEGASPVGPFTDQVCYLGVDKNTSEEKQKWCLAFYEYLLTERSQQLLSALGAFSVRGDVPCPYGNGLLVDLDRAYREPIVPDPFLYQRHKASLMAEAVAALGGDEAAKTNFFQRLAIVIGS